MRRSIRDVFFAVFAASLPFWAGAATAASFDCNKAATRVEQRICSEPDVNSLDSQLEAAYQGALDRSNHPERVKKQQEAWLKTRDACPTDKCMSAAYLEQIKLLSAISDEPPVCNGASTPEVNACMFQHYRRADRELARYVAAVRERLTSESKEDSAGQASKKALTEFDASQVAWEAYRKAECNAVYTWWSEGTIRGAMEGGCLQAVTESRTESIWSTWLHFMDSTPPLMPKPARN